ncbi:lipid droplet-associated protein [Actinocrispum sp. NPDC049592]|uniref:lipid droplet-associated protein n=1 Tax=Actinocrispum sp. NPDC049592 TaxID=3154835 RepID=UPI0034275CF2
MTPLPLPIRVAAGLAATAVERARELPEKLVGLPVTVASQAMQLSMRVQQHVTALAIKGDEALAAFRPVEETPEWATFDEDIDSYDVSKPETNGRAPDPWEMESSAISEAEDAVEPPAGLPNYDELTLPQLRARLRGFSLAELQELLRYEEGNAARPSFIGMLTRRITSVSAASPPEEQ